jgi:hypothetical protein
VSRREATTAKSPQCHRIGSSVGTRRSGRGENDAATVDYCCHNRCEILAADFAAEATKGERLVQFQVVTSITVRG